MSKWKCVELGDTCGFTEGRVYEVKKDGTIYYNGGGESSAKLSINGNKAKCWNAKFEKVEEKKDMNKFKVGDMIKGTHGSGYGWTNEYMTKGQVTKVYSRGTDDIEVQILEHSKGQKIGHKFDVNSNKFDHITPSKKSIHLTFDGNTTHAIIKEDGKVVKREKVGLCRGDVYDEATGVREVIDKLYGKKVVEDVKPKFVKAKVGDTIKIVNNNGNHIPFVKNNEVLVVESVYDRFINTANNSFNDYEEEYIIINSKTPISEYTTDELLSEIKKRMER